MSACVHLVPYCPLVAAREASSLYKYSVCYFHGHVHVLLTKAGTCQAERRTASLGSDRWLAIYSQCACQAVLDSVVLTSVTVLHIHRRVGMEAAVSCGRLEKFETECCSTSSRNSSVCVVGVRSRDPWREREGVVVVVNGAQRRGIAVNARAH